MKKFLSKVLTLALVCAIVVTSTSITSEAKGKKSSKKAVATTYSSNAVVNDFVATMLKSNGLTISGKSYNSQELITLGFAANPAVTVSPMYWQDDGIFVHDNGYVENTGGRCCGFYLSSDGIGGFNPYADCSGTELIYNSDIAEYELGDMKAYGYTNYDDNAILNSNGVWYTDTFVTNGVNAQYISSWMQSRGLNTATDVYNYLVANGATFTADAGLVNTGRLGATVQSFGCVQCPNLYYDIDDQGTRIHYTNDKLSGVNIVDISSYSTSTLWCSALQH
ncbi:MAG: hypothetical protein IJ535_10810 [Pseudobutyrivibrio sp.]|uniref:hypothetical protein n=1 Tax=Pseudobutyrivibrio sp. TaxID=2014367 RepID=UPI0025D2D6EF|nr:hypothetical protein [Pseudobutyrivibrio sp.]MBQ8490258.1 hypothetical protein [Pseudobutyrivibrio sp.]